MASSQLRVKNERESSAQLEAMFRSHGWLTFLQDKIWKPEAVTY